MLRGLAVKPSLASVVDTPAIACSLCAKAAYLQHLGQSMGGRSGPSGKPGKSGKTGRSGWARWRVNVASQSAVPLPPAVHGEPVAPKLRVVGKMCVVTVLSRDLEFLQNCRQKDSESCRAAIEKADLAVRAARAAVEQRSRPTLQFPSSWGATLEEGMQGANVFACLLV